MQREKQERENRIEVARLVEIRQPGAAPAITGTTQNMSQAGLMARLNRSFRAGEILELSLALESEDAWITAHGEVVWCTNEIYGDGAQVGLRFIDFPEDEKPVLAENHSDDTAGPALPLIPGHEVTLLAGETVMRAVVEEVIDDKAVAGPVRVHLRMLDGHPAESSKVVGESEDLAQWESEQELLESADEWKPHPFRDLRRVFNQWVMPVVSYALVVLGPLLGLSFRMAEKLWRRVPLRMRVRVAAVIEKWQLNKRIAKTKQAFLSFLASIGGD